MPDHVAELKKWHNRCEVHQAEALSGAGIKAKHAQAMWLVAARMFECYADGRQNSPPCQQWFTEYKELWQERYGTAP
jgi:hypothetical protein